MPKTKSGYYSVNKGRVPGVYSTWAECEAQVKGFPGAIYKKFSTLEEAQAFALPGTSGSTSGIKDRLGSSALSSGSSQRTRTSNIGSEGAERSSRSTTVVDFNEVGATSSAQKKDGAIMRPIMAGGLESRGNISTDERMTIIVYTDGACSNNGKTNAVAGIGVWWGSGDERNLSERCPGAQTNNRAELIALIRTLETAPLNSGTKSRLIIKTDSKYSINCVQKWAEKWERNGWRKREGEPVKNADLIQYLLTLLVLCNLKGGRVELVHVYGHKGEVGNEAADKLARKGCDLPQITDLNWVAKKAEVENTFEWRSVSLSETKLMLDVGFEIDPSDLWTEEELEEFGRTQEF